MSTIAEKIGINERAFNILFSLFLLLMGYLLNEYRHKDNISEDEAKILVEKALQQQNNVQIISQQNIQNTLSRLEQQVVTMSNHIATLNISVARLETITDRSNAKK